MKESARYAWWLLILLFSLIISLNFALLVWLMREDRLATPEETEEAEISVKIALAFGADPTRNLLMQTAIERLNQPNWHDQIHKATLEAYIGENRYQETLQRAHELPTHLLTPAQRRWYTCLLQKALTYPPNTQQIPEILDTFRLILSPFYLRLMESTLYQRAGETSQADRIRSRLQFRGIMSFLIFAGFLGVIGLGIFFGLGILGWLAFNPPDFPKRPVENVCPFALDPLLWALVLFLLTIMVSPAEFLQSFLNGFGISAPTHSIVNQLFAGAIALAFLQTVRSRLGQGVVLNWFSPLGFWKQIQAVSAGVLTYVPIAVAGIVIVILLAPTLSSQQNPIVDTALGAGNWFEWMLIFVQAVVLAPIIEEFVFRGVLFQVLWQRTGCVWLSAFASGFLFAMIHPQFLAGLIPLTTIGTIVALLYAHTRSLVPAILLHMLNNLAVTLLLLAFSL